MPPIDWYFARGSKQMGPVSPADLKRLAAAGEIQPDDLVWREGLTEWAPARNVRGLFEEEAKAAGVQQTPAQAVAGFPGGFEPAALSSVNPLVARRPRRHVVDVFLDLLRRRFGPGFVETTAAVFRACGLYGLLAAMGLTAAFAVIAATKTGTFAALVSSFLLLALLVVLQYAAGKFCDVLGRLNQTTSGRLASAAFADCFALLSLLAGLAALLGSVLVAVEAAAYSVLLVGVVLLMVWGYLAIVALNPATLNISIVPEEARAGEEAIGVLMFLLKALLRLAPVAMGTGVVVGVLMMGYACYQALSEGNDILSASATAAIASKILICSAAWPMATYLLFVLCSLAIDVCRAVLVIPGKLDKAAEKGQEQQPVER